MPPPPPPPAPQRPVLIDLDGPAPSPADAPPVEGPAALPAAPPRAAAAATGGFGRLAGWVLGSFAAFVLSVALWDFVAGLLARDGLLGTVALVLAGAAVAVLAVLALREGLAFARAARIDRLREQVVQARTADLPAARRAVAAVAALYAARPETAWARDRLAARGAEVLDADALVALAETELMAPLDRAATAEIEAAARRVALVTAFVPLALADVAAAAWANLAMLRRLSVIYGGRPGALGGWRLMRRVFAHLVATGALALTDDLLGSVAGGGLLGRLSRRFGEGLVNGALTARVGVAAMELCRPMPFAALERPAVAGLVTRALAGLAGGARSAGSNGQA